LVLEKAATIAELVELEARVLATGTASGDPGAEGTTPGMSISDAHSATVSDALSGALSGAIGSLTGGMMGTTPDATATALGVALGLAGLGPMGAPAAAAAVGASNAQTAAMSGLTGLTAGEISNAMAAANQTAADAAAGTALGPGVQGGAEEPDGARDRRGTPPASLSLRDYLAWLRSASTIPVRGALASTPFGTFAVPVYHAGGVVAPGPGRRGLREAMIMAEPGEFLEAINANDPAQIQRQARTLSERLTRCCAITR
jgi:hypothetical protein